MHIMESYADLLTEIAVIKEQIELIDQELEYWLTENNIPLNGKGSQKFGANTAILQTNKKVITRNKLQDRLKDLEYAKVRIEILVEQFEGLDYKIAYSRLVKQKTHKEIAKELGYTEQYIRECWSRIKTYKQPTQL